ncbi:type II secretion system protein N [Desulfurispira natronophila]|uniref:Type II secretion system protein N n=1 Tax=Desulfurispira natronophila TaxID=682562 RepID=A0A7W7Y371_9BACT|nr:type II secretion system protein N [Desulfurispira natronophila]MBB5021232.1 hypothetical protein [Desulfurispira natronophila]
MLSRKSILLIALLFFASYLLFAAVTLPAQLTWSQVQKQLPAEDVALTQIEGTLWRGSGQFHYQQHSVPLSWRVRLAELLRLRAGVEVSLSDPGLQSKATVSLSPAGTLRVTLDGQVHPARILELAQFRELEIPGPVRLEQLEVHLQGSHFSHATGNTTWSGGTVRSILPGNHFEIDFPALEGRLELEDDGPIFSIARSGDDQPILQASLNENGWARLVLMNHLTRAIDLPWPIQGGRDGTIISYEEKVF